MNSRIQQTMTPAIPRNASEVTSTIHRSDDVQRARNSLKTAMDGDIAHPITALSATLVTTQVAAWRTTTRVTAWRTAK